MLNKEDINGLSDCEEIKKSLLMAEKEWKRTFDALPDLITILDSEHQVVKVNQAMADSLGVSPEDAVGKRCYEVVHGSNSPITHCPHSMLLADGTEHTSEVQEDNLGGYFLVTATPIKDNEGNIVGSVHVARNITQRVIMENKLRKTLEEKDMLMKEIHHRVKNNLMVMSSLLNLQSSYIKDDVTRDIFNDSQSRAKSMALIHERLYRSGDFKSIAMKEYVEQLSNDLFHIYMAKNSRIDLILDVQNITLDVDTAIPLGLILNELLTNSMKYAFPNNEKGVIKVNLKKTKDEEFLLEVKDNGIGMSSDFDVESVDSLGMKLIMILTQQINGHLEFDFSNGTRFSINFHETTPGD